MATNKRDVVLGVAVETSGEEDLQGLAGDLRNVGDSAAGAAPDAAALTAQLDKLAAATKEKRQAEAAARSEAAAARKALDDQRDALARFTAGSDAATRATAEHQAALRAQRLAVVEARIALREKQQALNAATTEAKQAAAAETQLGATIQQTARATVAGNAAVGSSIEQLRGQLGLLRNVATAALGGSLVGSLARDLAQTADAAAGLQARIKLVTGEGQAFSDAWAGVGQVAQRTGADLEATGTLFTRILQAGKDFGLAQRDALALTETINQAVAVSGASAQASEAAITQLIQGLQSGVLRGEEFNSVMEQAPRLAQALAAGLGVTTGELRKMAEAGALTSQVVIQALQGQADTLRREFDQLPATIGRSITQLSNAWTVYVGDTAQATGASKAAAEVIAALAANLDTVAGFLYGAGKAGAALVAVKLGAAFLEAAAGARVAATATAAATAATVAHTAATTANTAAQGANAAASAGAAANAGRFAAILGGLKVTALLAVLTNLKEIGTAIGEGAARLMGAGKAIDALAESEEREAEAARRNAAAHAEQAQQAQQAADAVLGLGKESKRLISVFEEVEQKAGTTSEALDKMSKSFKPDLQGVADFGAALDALAVRGKISAHNVSEAWGKALAGEDLLRFETMAKAAFDGSAQGARRLQAAIDAVREESLRRAGTSAEEFATGFSKGATRAVNDLDILARTLREVKAPADEASQALQTAVDKALAASNTERAVQAVIDRIKALGVEGLLTGDRLAEALEKARKKLDDIKPGISSLDEALRKFGLRSQEEAARTADSFRKAWDVIRVDGTVAIDQKIAAFAKYREAAIAANKGVESSEIAVQRIALETQATVAGLGDTFERAMGRAKQSVRGLRDEIQQANAAAGSLSASVDNARQARSTVGGATYDDQGFATGPDGQRITAGSQLTPPDSSGNWTFVSDATALGGSQTVTLANGRRVSGRGVQGVGYWVRTDGGAGFGVRQGQGVTGGALTGSTEGTQGAGFSVPPPAAAPTPGPSSAPLQPVVINLNGKPTQFNVASPAEAQAVQDLMRVLAQGFNASEGGA